MSLVYLDSSALVRLERRAGFGTSERRWARQVLSRVEPVDVDRRTLAAAAALDPPTLRTLDAIHLATALTLREDLTALVTYDRRLAAAAERAHVEVLAPA